MSTGCLAFSFPSANEARLRLPGIAAWWTPGDPIPDGPVRDQLRTLGLDVGAVVGERLLRILGGLALARTLGRTEVQTPELWALAFPGRDLRSVANALAECLRRERLPRASLASPWPGPEDPRLVQVAHREGRVQRTVGALRLNPTYSVEVEVDALRRWLAGPDAERAELRAAGWESVAERVAPLIAAGNEGSAWQLLTPLDDVDDPRVVLLRAQLGMQVGASDEAARLAALSGRHATAAHDRAAYAESLHVRALAARQLGDLAGSLRAVDQAIEVIRALPETPELRARRWQFRLTRAITRSVSAFSPTPRRPFLLRGDNPPAWRAATQSFRALARDAEAAGSARDFAHVALRLAAHELGRWEVRDDVLSSMERAEAGRRDLSPAAQVILDRVKASDRLLRSGDAAAATELEEIRARDEARGYRHQVKIIDETFALARAARARR